MVLKQSISVKQNDLQFENDVKMYGTETQIRQLQYPLVFENDVKMYGTKTDK